MLAYYETDNLAIIHGDNMAVMPEIRNNSVDTIITDPPYGLGFMGKEWDTFSQKYLSKHRQDDKKRSHRTDGRLVASWGNAADSGSYDQSVKGHISFQEWFRPIFIEMLRVTKPGGTLLCFGGTRTYHRVACAAEEAGWIIKDCIMWIYGSGFPKATDISKQLDKKNNTPPLDTGIISPISCPNIQEDLYKSGKVGKNFNLTTPNSKEAKLWNGWKSHGLKPAYEPILVAMKPNDGTYANNALVHGVSGLNIDGSRVDYQSGKDKKEGQSSRPSKTSNQNDYTLHKGGLEGMDRADRSDLQGRYPANIILDKEVAEEAGDWSRYFYCAKASKRERNKGCEDLVEKNRSNANKMMGESGQMKTGSGNDRTTKFKNHHPTVKPLALMEYLCTLTKTPTGGIVLDPFMGSGTTGLAAKNTDRQFLGIEKEEEYCEIAKARLSQ